MQISQSKILRATANAPRYVTNHTLHTDFNIPYDIIDERINKHHNKLEAHPNPLLEPLLQRINTRRLKRCWPLDLQGTWCDTAEWIHYHIIVIHGIVAYLYNHHISLYRLYSFWLLINNNNNNNNKKIIHFRTYDTIIALLCPWYQVFPQQMTIIQKLKKFPHVMEPSGLSLQNNLTFIHRVY